MSTGDVEVDVEVPLTGIIMDALLPQQFGGGALQTGAAVCPTCGQPWPAGRPMPPGMSQTPGTAMPSNGGAFTGLIIDARDWVSVPPWPRNSWMSKQRDLRVQVRVPRICVDIGMVGYEKDVDRARTNERVTNNPLVIKGIQASGPNKTDVVVNAADAAAIHGAAANMNFLQHCKVMFILD